ncbi:hypothetical protein MKW98_010610 [Papaver atlanticum]|uniref:O-methyltransferase C-terminal domain-containing protein n=1 Tax=Papaver atlanticum TaxID=357466 RepID=A0AAD4S2I5_9MAGN|nr:hypothetical protein MKW98_010610 [Papaver atlanticum]
MDSTSQEEIELIQADTHIWKCAFSYASSMSLKSRTDPLNSLMRFMIHSGFFATQNLAENQEQQAYVLTATSRLLVKANANTMSSVVLSMVDPFMASSLHSLSTWFQGSESTPFVAAHGMTLWNMLEQNPEFGKNFHDSMANDLRKSLVDVEGGIGTTAHAVVGAFPHLNCMVLDLPNVCFSLMCFGLFSGCEFILLSLCSESECCTFGDGIELLNTLNSDSFQPLENREAILDKDANSIPDSQSRFAYLTVTLPP